jgi:hypothetical protein
MVGWAARDLSAALSWVGNLPEGPARTIAGVALAYEAARNEPLAAVDLAVRLARSEQTEEVLVYALNQWAAADSAAAAQWVDQVTDEALRSRLWVTLALAIAKTDAAAAATLAVQAVAPGADQDRAVVGVVERWAQTAPQEAAAWVSRFPAGALQEAAAHNLLGVWTSFDSAAARSWVEQLPEGSLRATALAACANAPGLAN